ncbi:MAG: ABC transporter permease [Bacteroidales bacterium]|nr:ABC transporter permease [Bacteroidales bacterium]
MRTILYILQKEFIQIFRNRTMLPLIFVLPVVQLLILVNAATLELKNIDMVIVNNDFSSTSQSLISKFKASPFFHVNSFNTSVQEAEKQLLNNSASVVLVIPSNFEENLIKENTSEVQFLINAIDGMAAGLINVYANNILQDFNSDIRAKWISPQAGLKGLPIDISYRFWFNPNLKYTIYMLPGILVILVTVIGMFLTALNIVREKEMGTIEQINVTPTKKYQFIIGKLLPFLIIALFELAFGIVLGRLIFNLPIEGNLFVVFLLALTYLFVALGLGLFLSTISSNQQQVMFTIYFFLLVFILMSGIFTSTDSMPQWAKYFNMLNPFAYFMKALRMALLKGSGIADIAYELVSLAIYAVTALSLAVWRYRKTV